MPFFKLDFKTETTLNLVETNEDTIITPIPSPDRVPIFLIPSLGNGGDLFPLAWEIKQLTDAKRPIYAYFDRLLVNDSEQAATSLQEKAEEIAHNMERHLCFFHPGIIISDGYGCGVSFLVAEYLKKQNKDTFLYSIDGATAALSTHHLQNKPEQNTLEMWEIMLRVAKQCQLDINEINANELEAFSKIPFETRLGLMADKLIAFNQKPELDAEKLENFEKLIQAATDHLKLIYNYKKNSHFKTGSPNICIHVLLTNKTISTFGQSFCGWLQCTNQDNIDNYNSYDKPLENNLAELSKNIVDFISDHISKEYLLRKQWEHLAYNLENYLQLEENSINNAIITDASAALYESAKKISPSSSLVDSPILARRGDKSVTSSNTNNFSFFRSHSLPTFNKVTSEQEVTTSVNRKVLVIA